MTTNSDLHRHDESKDLFISFLPAAVVALAGGSIAALNAHSVKPQTVAATEDVSRADSIPYFISHARQGEPWAYEALADCYRYGKGGLKRSFMNAMFYYGLAGKDVFSAETLPGDPFSVFMRMIDSDTCRCRPGTHAKKLSA